MECLEQSHKPCAAAFYPRTSAALLASLAFSSMGQCVYARSQLVKRLDEPMNEKVSSPCPCSSFRRKNRPVLTAGYDWKFGRTSALSSFPGIFNGLFDKLIDDFCFAMEIYGSACPVSRISWISMRKREKRESEAAGSSVLPVMLFALLSLTSTFHRKSNN